MKSTNSDYKKTSAKGYSPVGAISFHPSVTKGSGSICSNVIDLYKWNRALFGHYVISKKSLIEMTTPADAYGYCYGLSNKHNLIFHGGQTHCFATSYNYNNDHDVTIIAMTNVITENEKTMNIYPVTSLVETTSKNFRRILK